MSLFSYPYKGSYLSDAAQVSLVILIFFKERAGYVRMHSPIRIDASITSYLLCLFSCCAYLVAEKRGSGAYLMIKKV